MIITKQKPFQDILKSLQGIDRIFLIGCGECSTTCKSGGADELKAVKLDLEKNNKIVVGSCIPSAPCVAAQIKTELAKNIKLLHQADVILVFACGLGVQSVKENDRSGKTVLPALDTLFGGTVDAKGSFCEKCSMCGDCLLDLTAGICPITLCPKGLLNGPCGGMDKGKCEVDKDRDCAWVLIYKEMEKRNKLQDFKKILPPKDFKKTTKPHKLTLAQ
jgi:hypothetical protein